MTLLGQKKNIISCVSLDWLQVHTKIIVRDYLQAAQWSKTSLYKLEKKDIKSNIFRSNMEVQVQTSNGWEPCAVVSFDPLSSILPENSAHVKILNKFLYQSDLKRLLDTVIDELGLKYYNVSRLDVCMDMKKFHRLSCPQFIKLLLAKKYLKKRSISIHLDGLATKTMPIHYLRFGTRNSQIEYYLYNKSKQLREVSDKPYIKEKWLLHNLNDKHYDVWRLEFSIKPSQFGIVDTNGEPYTFSQENVTDENFLSNLFHTLFNQHFVFVVNDGQQRKDRMKEVVLLKPRPFEAVYVRLSEKMSSNRMDKVFIKKMELLNRQWRLHNKDPILVDDLLSEFIERHGLTDWYNNYLTLKKQEHETTSRIKTAIPSSSIKHGFNSADDAILNELTPELPGD